MDLKGGRKTQLLKRVYNFDPKNAVRSLEARGGCPYNLWRKVLCNRDIDLGAIVEDHQSVRPQYADAIDLGDTELTIRRGAMGKTRRVRDLGDWTPAFGKYGSGPIHTAERTRTTGTSSRNSLHLLTIHESYCTNLPSESSS